MIKTLLRSFAGLLGYDVLSRRRPGIDAWRDIQRIHQRGTGQEGVILDIGANIGQTAEKLLLEYPRSVVHSFEPTPAAFQQLARLAERHDGKLFCHQQALASQEGKMKFHLSSTSVTNSLLPRTEESAGDHSIEVDVGTVDSFCQRAGIDRVLLLKSDAQGADLTVLEGAERMLREGRIKFVMAEVLFAKLYDNQCWFHEVFAHLTARGYRLMGLYAPIVDEQGGLAWADALFHRPDAA